VVPPVNATGLSELITPPDMSPESCHWMYSPALSVYVVVVFAGAATTPVPAGNAEIGLIRIVVASCEATTCSPTNRDPSCSR
jgi:hypothetical protein